MWRAVLERGQYRRGGAKGDVCLVRKTAPRIAPQKSYIYERDCGRQPTLARVFPDTPFDEGESCHASGKFGIQPHRSFPSHFHAPARIRGVFPTGGIASRTRAPLPSTAHPALPTPVPECAWKRHRRTPPRCFPRCGPRCRSPHPTRRLNSLIPDGGLHHPRSRERQNSVSPLIRPQNLLDTHPPSRCH